MIAPQIGFYPEHETEVWVLCDLREPDAVRFIHSMRAAYQEHSDLAGFGPDHLILLIFPGGALEAAA